MAPEKITTISPSDNKPIVTRTGVSKEESIKITQNAVHAFQSYKTTKLVERQDIVRKALRIMESRTKQLSLELTQQMGRPIAYAGVEIRTAIARAEYMLKVSDETMAESSGEPEDGFKRYIKKVPIGPVLIIFPWNYPYLTLFNTIIPALLAGNTVILKPSPQTPTVAEQVQSMFLEAGLPENVLQYFHCGSLTQLEEMVRSTSIQLVCFTGSVAGGLAIQKAASERVAVRVGLELGGKDPAYVREDVDVKSVAAEIVDGAVFNSGQSCCSVERVYVHENIYDSFISAVQDILKTYKVGDPSKEDTMVGPVISKEAKKKIQAHVEEAMTKGARDCTPENSSFKSMPADGNYVSPTLLVDVNHSMQIMAEETFGPVIPVMKVKDDAEATAKMNDSIYGLTASIWTKDTDKGTILADEVEAGTVFVNRCDFPSPDLAWTGWKDSGRGVTLSKFGFDQFVKLKSYHIKG